MWTGFELWQKAIWHSKAFGFGNSNDCQSQQRLLASFRTHSQGHARVQRYKFVYLFKAFKFAMTLRNASKPPACTIASVRVVVDIGQWVMQVESNNHWHLITHRCIGSLMFPNFKFTINTDSADSVTVTYRHVNSSQSRSPVDINMIWLWQYDMTWRLI